jgi:RNA polymerase sigma factor (TIGR02999 family)
MEALPGQVTCLRQWSGGDAQALEQLVPIVYNELQRLAHYHLRRERDGHTLQTTALVHEVYLRLCSQDEPQWENRAHFFAVAARMMRHILVDYSRRHGATKRGGAALHAPLDDALTIPMQEQFDLVTLDGALEQLAAFDARKCQVVEMRFFAGLPAEEIAAVLNTTEATVRLTGSLPRAGCTDTWKGIRRMSNAPSNPGLGSDRARLGGSPATARGRTGGLPGGPRWNLFLAAHRRSNFLGDETDQTARPDLLGKMEAMLARADAATPGACTRDHPRRARTSWQ